MTNPESSRRIRLCVIVTVDITIQNLCKGRLEYFIANGFDVTVVCAPTPLAKEIEARGVRLHTAPLARSISPFRDLRALLSLYRFLRAERFDLVEVSTPKGSLIGAVAARLAGVQCVVHLLRGLAYQGQRGLGGMVLRWAHKIACRFSHRVICVSGSGREQAGRDGICAVDKMIVLGRGSSNGVDVTRFSPSTEKQRADARQAMGLPAQAVVAGFVGRITRDKGIAELVQAFIDLREKRPTLHLLMVGGLEHRDQPSTEVMARIVADPRIKQIEWQQDAQPSYLAMDFVVLPSHREGLANVLLEAGAMSLPVVTTDAVGCRDAIVEGETGFCVPIGDVTKLGEAMDRLAGDATLRHQMGKAARSFMERNYDCVAVWARQEQEFRRLLGCST